MNLECMSLNRQLDIVFRALSEELRFLTSGTVFVQIRNNAVGKFGIRHDPLDMSREGGLPESQVRMNEEHLRSFRQMALGSLEHKKNWTHGEIYFEFAMRKDVLSVSVQFESNYNMSSLTGRPLSAMG